MIDKRTIDYLHDLLSEHGEVKSLLSLGDCMVLATMKSSEDVSSVSRHYNFQIFGFDSLIIGKDWISQNCTEAGSQAKSPNQHATYYAEHISKSA